MHAVVLKLFQEASVRTQMIQFIFFIRVAGLKTAAIVCGARSHYI